LGELKVFTGGSAGDAPLGEQGRCRRRGNLRRDFRFGDPRRLAGARGFQHSEERILPALGLLRRNSLRAVATDVGW
jgi:hypothetical protein